MTDKMIRVKQPNGTIVERHDELVKLKGIRQTLMVQGINHEFMKEQMMDYLAGGDLQTTSVPQWGIRTQLCREGQTIITSDQYSKDFKLMDDDHIKGQRMVLAGVRDPKVYPYGYIFS